MVRLGGILAALFLGAVPSTALGQRARGGAPDAAQAATATEARRLFEVGLAALDEQRYADAALAFESSLQLRDNAVVRFNLGLAYRSLGRVADAIASFERYLVRPPRNAQARELQRVREQLEALRRRLATITARWTPTTATATIDGRLRLEAGVAATLDPGRRTLLVEAEGYRSETRELVVEPGAQEALEVSLQRELRPGRLLISSTTAGVRAFVDDAAVPSVPHEASLLEGSYRVRLEAAGHLPEEREVTVAPNGTVRLDLALRAILTPERPRNVWVRPVAITAGVVAAAALLTTVVVLSTRPGPYDPDPNQVPAWLGLRQEQRMAP